MLTPKFISGSAGGTNGDVPVGVSGTKSDGSDVASDVNVDADADADVVDSEDKDDNARGCGGSIWCKKFPHRLRYLLWLQQTESVWGWC